ncbi:hypothetical protein, partial [Segatella copri]|uniref:hypothetical protein n=1 Tax=Segatella copri TaxID=165179 RepID=UPI001C44AB46
RFGQQDKDRKANYGWKSIDFSFADKGLLKLRYINVPKFEKNLGTTGTGTLRPTTLLSKRLIINKLCRNRD